MLHAPPLQERCANINSILATNTGLENIFHERMLKFRFLTAHIKSVGISL